MQFEKPYDSPRVQAVLDDARSYIQNSDDRLDLILFSLLDSPLLIAALLYAASVLALRPRVREGARRASAAAGS